MEQQTAAAQHLQRVVAPHPSLSLPAAMQPQISWNPVVTVNPVTWSTKVQRMVQAGKDKTFIVIDFDRTITKCYLEDGGRALDCHDILASCPKITWGCKRMMELLMDKYYPIEIDAKMTKEEKIPHMVEWYKLVNQLLAAQDLTRDDVETAVRGCTDFRLRNGVEELFQIAHRNGIPVIVVSAGLGNVIEEVIRQCIRKPSGEVGTPWENVRVLSNTLLWNAEGRFKGHSEPLIHMFNKSLQDAPTSLKHMIAGRHVGLLCGDGLGDLTMADGHDTTTVLRVGFLNEKIDERLEQYCAENAYDRVVLNDGTYEPVLEVLRQL
jgi:5'-nucleotidase